MDEALLHDLCARARLVQARGVQTEAGLRGLTDLVRSATGSTDRYSHEQLLQVIDAAPRPVGFRPGLQRLGDLAGARTEPPADWSTEEREEYAAAQTALLRGVGKDRGEPAPGPVGVARNVVEQFLQRWF